MVVIVAAGFRVPLSSRSVRFILPGIPPLPPDNYPASFYGIDIQNPAADRISTGNVIRYNNVIGGLAALGTYDSAKKLEDPETTIKGWDMNYNRYYSPSGTWLLVSGVSQSITNRWAIYQNSNDSYSKIVSSKIVTWSEAPIFDSTSTISW